jgi:hypothetical protein
MSTLFFGPAKLIAHWPYAGVMIAAVLILVQAGLTARAGRGFGINFFREATVFAGLLWLIYGFYERQAAVTFATTGELSALTRFDLIVLVPILYLMTAAAIYSLFRQTKAQAKAQAKAQTKSTLSRETSERDKKDRDEEGRG